MTALLTVEVRHEADVVLARQRARQVALLLGFEGQDQVRIATAVSELARNVVQYAGRGRVDFGVELGHRPALEIRVTDEGPGIGDLEAILEGSYTSTTGMGLGLVGARRLMDSLSVTSGAGTGTSILLTKVLPVSGPRDRAELGRVAKALASEAPAHPLAEVQQQNQDLLRALSELSGRQEEMSRLNRELQETNRGVVALYAELDDRAESLKRADALKSRFLSNVSHEFRTPLNSILALSRLLEERADGELTAEQAKQVAFIRKAAQDLTELVNDLLDLAKVEAGRVEVRPSQVDLPDLFGTLRGMMRALATNPAVTLVCEDPPPRLTLFTDEGKVSQILRNLVSNALKFTEQGEVRVCVKEASSGDSVVFAVSDTGIGIDPLDHDRVFQEFGQIENPLQHRAKGTGLGLPLSRKLAELLGGTLVLRSAPAEGSTLFLTLPRRYPAHAAVREPLATEAAFGPLPALRTRGRKVLVVDDDDSARYRLRRTLESLGLEVLEASRGLDGVQKARSERPDAVFLDLVLPDASGFDILEMMHSDPVVAEIPVVVVSSSEVTTAQAERLRRPGTAFVSKQVWDASDPEAAVREALLLAGWGSRLTGAEPR